MQSVIPWLVVVAAVILFWYFRRPEVSPAQAQEMVRSGAALIDVRSPGEFAGGHIEGARNIPVGDIGDRSGEIGPHDRTVIVYCASGTRSAIAARRLRSQGFAKVYNLGAMSNWR